MTWVRREPIAAGGRPSSFRETLLWSLSARLRRDTTTA